MTDQDLLDTPDGELNAGLFYRKYKLRQAAEGRAGSAGRKNMVELTEVYAVFSYYSDKKGKTISGNQLTKAMRAEGQKMSNERGKLLAPQLAERYDKEKQDDKR